jgi:hypothetical protein
MRERRESPPWFCLVMAASAVALQGLHGCGKPPVAFRAQAVSPDAGPGTGGGPANTGGAAGLEPETPGTGGAASGGTGGKADAGRGGTGGGEAADANMALPDVAVSDTGGIFGTGGATEDAGAGGTGGSPGSGGQGGSAGTGGVFGSGGMSGTGGQAAPPDAATPPPSNGRAECYPDPKVILICKQLEPACQNCRSGTDVNECYRLSETGNDGACARYAVDNRCTVDQGGNWCGSLNCEAQGCPRTNCRTVQGNGASPACQMLLDECPCE